MKTIKCIALLLAIVMTLALFAGCSNSPANDPATDAPATDAPSTAPDNSDNTDGNDIPAEGLTFPNPVEAPETITTVGPDGSPAAWYTELELTPEELAQVRSMNLTACFELINASEWDNANLIGFQDACEAMNIKIVGQGCCDLDPIQQKTNMESFAALNPDIVTCQPQDLDVCAPTFDPLWQAGVKLTFMSNVPTGYTAGKEYVGAITDSIVDMGIDSAEMMADATAARARSSPSRSPTSTTSATPATTPSSRPSPSSIRTSPSPKSAASPPRTKQRRSPPLC